LEEPREQARKHVFQADNPRRWKRMRFGIVLGGLLVLAALGVAATILFSVPGLTTPKFARTSSGGEAQGVIKRYTPVDNFRQSRANVETFLAHRSKMPGYSTSDTDAIRAGFFVNWDMLSYKSLKAHLGAMNAVFLEWGRLLPNRTDSLIFEADSNAAKLLAKHPEVHVHCMVTNYDEHSQLWQGTWLESLRNDVLATQLVRSIVQLSVRNHFYGINIDFENVPKDVQPALKKFLTELKAALHQHGMALSFDAPADDDNFDLKAYADATDYVVLMAYDEHSAGSVPGPVSSTGWFISQVERALHSIPAQKLIVGLATYGYDWPTEQNGGTLSGTEVSFDQAAVIARESDTIPVFDTTSGSLHFSYDEDDSTHHDVWVNDAVTIFNQLSILDNYDVGGTAIWRLGAEDPSMWSIYARMSDRRNPKTIDSLRRILPSHNPEYQGEGELLALVADPHDGRRDLTYDQNNQLITGEHLSELPSSYTLRRYGKNPHKVVLTFDDGPDPQWTPKILDVLSAKHVPALFFVVGENAQRNFGLLKRIYEEGHEVGNHTLTHPNIALISEGQTVLELSSTQNIIRAGTLAKTVLFRPPYVADAEPTTLEELLPVARAARMGYLMVGSAIDPQDWHTPITAQRIIDTSLAQRSLGSIILLHDAGGDRSATLEALPILIDSLRARGDTLVSLHDFIGVPKASFMPLLTGGERSNAILDRYVLTGTFAFQVFLSDIFFLAIVLSIARMLLIGILAVISWRRARKERFDSKIDLRVTVVIPAYNENVVVVRTVETVLASKGAKFDVIVVDDGSKDDTYEVVKHAFRDNDRVRVFTKPNGGKASALNYGIARTTSDVIIVIDADTVFEPEALCEMLKYFAKDEEVGAVAGNVKVGNVRNILTRWQAIEYITSQNFDRRAFELLGAITVVPGAIGAFRRTALEEVGLYTSDTLAEDTDLTMRIVQRGWKVRYAENARAWTEAPEKIKPFLKQRFRWTFGTMQAFWKHRMWLFNPKAGALGMIAMPNILFFQILLPLLAPIVDLIFVLSLFSGDSDVTIISYLVFLAIDLLGSIVAFSLEGEKLRLIGWLLLQRFMYRQMMYYVLFKSIFAALRGQLQGWGKLQRTGNVTVSTKTSG